MPGFDSGSEPPQARPPQAAPGAIRLRLACLLCRLLAALCALACAVGVGAGVDDAPLLTIAVLAAIVGAAVTGNSSRRRLVLPGK